MARKSKQLDKKMLSVGKKLLIEGGISGLSVRVVARKANANLGMFNYYFGSKSKFIKLLLEQSYGPFLNKLQQAHTAEAPLEEVLFTMARFSRDHAQEILAIFRDLLCGDKELIRFVKQHFSSHLVILRKVLIKHFNKNNLNKKNLDKGFRHLIGSIMLTHLLVVAGARFNIKEKIDDDEFLMLKIRVAILGLNKIAGAASL